MATAAQANKISVTAAVDELVSPGVHHVPPVVATAFDSGIVKVPPWFDSSTNILTQAGRPTFYRQFCLSPPVAVRTMTVVERSQ